MAALGIAVASGGIGFVLADGLDRFLATYDPTATDKPKDKFTSDGAGTLANTLNIAAFPNWKRAVAGVAMTAVPAVGAMYVKNPYIKASAEGMAIGAGISVFKTIWHNVLMPLLIGKDTSPATLQKSYIARLYPAEVAAHINLSAQKGADGKMAPGPYSSTGVLSDAPAVGTSGADVGPFALAGDSPYPTADQALRHGVGGDSPYPTAAQALRTASGVSGDSPYPTAAQALRSQAGVSASDAWQPGAASDTGPGPQPAKADCGCIGETDHFTGFIGEAQEGETFFNTMQ